MKKQVFKFLLVSSVAGIFSFAVKAQYPTVPPDVKQSSDSLMKAARSHSDSAWAIAYPVVQEQANHGKPYIPWARRPYDLPQANIPAFPGAEGGGKYSFGGRGGRVIVVTNLNDAGPGSFRWACEQGGARIVVFNVSGIIHLKTPLSIRAPYITIEGQSAPGDGICIAGESTWIDTHDVIVRFMRFRRGETNVGRRDDALGGDPVGNVIIDHVSASWGLDENMSLYRHMYNDSTGKPLEEKLATVNLTIQNSISSESLDTWNHAFGSTLGGENCSFIRSLWADNTGRNPSIGWNGVFNFANNVVFNWDHRSIDGGDYTAMYNIINNYFQPGPATQIGHPIAHRILKPESGRSKLKYKVYGRVYVNGNVVEGDKEVTKDNWNGGVQVEELPDAGEYKDAMKYNTPFPKPEFTIIAATDARKFVLANAGATLPVRDAVDKRVIAQVTTGKIVVSPNIVAPTTQFKHRKLPLDSYKLGIITDINQVGGYPDYKGNPYKDSDNDGIPDAWETAHGLNPHDANDASKITKSGYSNIEVYLNSLVDVKTVTPSTQKK